MFQISEGAEIVKINKRFFLQKASNNTRLKLDTMVRYICKPSNVS